ncbi:MAG: site-2 protease family protein [Candidatus Peribacteraceae bacterium]
MLDILSPPFLISILVALSVHEWAHAYAATKLGDPTPYNEGRLTLNPIAHLDPIGTLMFFLVRFGWGKPVNVNPRYFSHPIRDNAIVALAGPFSNLVLAALSFLILVVWNPTSLSSVSSSMVTGGGSVSVFVAEVLIQMTFLNLSLMAFNLLPIAPLDGSKIIAPFIPSRYQWDYERFLQIGPMVLLGILIAERAFNFPILVYWVNMIANAFFNIFSLFLN